MQMQGLFCANYAKTRGGFESCQGVWCATCYTPDRPEEFPIQQMLEEDGIEIPKEEGDNDYLVARKGDDLMCMFQCEVCHFRNMEGREPEEVGSDLKIMRYIRRANLDAFWARRLTTVYPHFLEVRAIIKDADEMGIIPPLPKRGPLVLQDTCGMGAAVLLLKNH